MNMVHYQNEDGIDLFQGWLDRLDDRQAKVRILRRLDLLAEGNLGNCRPCREVMSELRIDHGPGYRINFFLHGFHLIVILGGEDKLTQGSGQNQTLALKDDYLKRVNEVALAEPCVAHEEATIESFRRDQAYAAEYLKAVLKDGSPEEIGLARRRVA